MGWDLRGRRQIAKSGLGRRFSVYRNGLASGGVGGVSDRVLDGMRAQARANMYDRDGVSVRGGRTSCGVAGLSWGGQGAPPNGSKAAISIILRAVEEDKIKTKEGRITKKLERTMLKKVAY
nr:hypothetical protein Iba_chr04aCG14170 [Ipomoea batatas]